MQSAFIGAETEKKNAQAYAEAAIPQAQALADAALQAARGAADSDLALARGETGAFLALDKEYRANPDVVRERLYRNGIERALSAAGQIRWVPPPVGSSYHGFHITVGPPSGGSSATSAGTPPAANDEEEGP